jgi:hypothetical protein
MLLSFNLVNSRAVALGKIYRERLIEMGGSDITEIGADGVARRNFKQWLADASHSDRERIAEIITSSIQTGIPDRQVAKELEKIPAMQKNAAILKKNFEGMTSSKILREYCTGVIRQERRYILNQGTMNRFKEEGIKQGIWNTLDPMERRHILFNGKKIDLDDPIWNELYLDGCKCWCGPVIPKE